MLFLAACSSAPLQEDGKVMNTEMEDAILKKALVRNDVATALVCIHQILEKDSSRHSLYDTLFQFYIEMQNPSGMADVGMILLEKSPNDLATLEATSAGLTALGEYPAALELEKRIFTVSGDPRFKIRIATLLFELQQVEEAKKEINWLLENRQTVDTVLVEQPMPSMQNKTQKVSMRAIAYFSLGQIEMELGNKRKAIEYWNKAMEVEPRYDMAASAILEASK